MFLGTAQAQALSLQHGPKLVLAASHTCGIQRITSRNAFEQQRGISCAPRDWPHVIKCRCEWKNAMYAYTPKTGFETYNPAQSRRNANRSPRVAANSRNTKTGSDRGCRTAAR